MAKHATCYFTLTSGLPGCYMPDSHWGQFAVTRRRDMIAAVRDVLAMLDAAPSAYRQIAWREVWACTARCGASCLHFNIRIADNLVLSFGGLTKDEFDQMENEDSDND